jgi:hypothetical protein
MARIANSVVVVAHPDDEVLWFSSWLEIADEVVICFIGNDKAPKLQAAREKALKQHIVKHISCLGLAESGAYKLASWQKPKITEFGLEISSGHANENVMERIRDKVSPRRRAVLRNSARLYRSNYYRLKDELRPKLVSCARVITHSPWGEYGHEEHVQVYRAVMSLRGEFDFEVSFPNYCSNRTLKLMSQELVGKPIECETRLTNELLAKTMMEIYKFNGCWTWFNNWAWFREESFITMNDSGDKCIDGRERIPLNFIGTEPGS